MKFIFKNNKFNIVFLLPYLFYLVILIYFRKQIRFKPAEFSTEYGKLLGIFTISLYSYIVIKKYWKYKKSEYIEYYNKADINNVLIRLSRYAYELSSRLIKYCTQGNPEKIKSAEVRKTIIHNNNSIKKCFYRLEEINKNLKQINISEQLNYVLMHYNNVLYPILKEYVDKYEKIDNNKDICDIYYRIKNNLDDIGLKVAEVLNVFYEE